MSTCLREMHIEPTALNNGFVPVDIDVTPFDNSKSNKEGVSRTYKGFDGYAPIMAYIGTEGYLVNLELRIGKQHCQKETPDFLRETIELCQTADGKTTAHPAWIPATIHTENIGIFDGAEKSLKKRRSCSSRKKNTSAEFVWHGGKNKCLKKK